MNILSTITAGDSAQWDDGEQQVNGVAAQSSVWTLRYYLRGASTLDLTATANGTGWRTTISTAQSAALSPGNYTWSAVISKSGERVTLATGTITVAKDVSAQAAGYDGRSSAKQALDAARTAYYAYTSNNVATLEYEIEGRRMKFNTAADMIAHISALEQQVLKEENAASIAAGSGSLKRFYVRFSGVR